MGNKVAVRSPLKAPLSEIPDSLWMRSSSEIPIHNWYKSRGQVIHASTR